MKRLLAARIYNVVAFLRARGWVTQPSMRERLQKLVPPTLLDLAPGFTLTLPVNDQAQDSAEFIAKTIETIAVIYDLSPEQLEAHFASADTVLSVQFCDEKTRFGTIPFLEFEGFLESIKKALVDVASFVATGSPILGESTAEAETFMAGCQFLQTERGSFVANIQLPADKTLREPTLFDPDPLTTDAVTARFTEILDFVVGPIFSRQPDLYDSQAIDRYASVINVDVLDDFRQLFVKTNADAINFDVLTRASTKQIHSGALGSEALGNLTEYVAYLRAQIVDNIAIDLTGRIVELRSRNPSADRNYVVIATEMAETHVFLALSLNNMQYQVAIQAHRTNVPVRVMGAAKRMKTQLKLTRLDEFTVVA